jgi:hypothetical protein
MISWVVGLAFLATAQAANPQEPCPSGKPVRLISNLVPALGQSPMWAATGGKPIAWEGPAAAVRVLWLRDVKVKGPAFLSGKLHGTASGTTTARFATSMFGTREPRLKLDHIGDKPNGIKEADLQKYAFHWTFVWFPSPGCYAMTGQVGTQKSVIYVNVAPTGKTGT